jgi:inorganic pyrophosphatase
MIKDRMKVICVPVSDPIWNSLNDLSDMNPLLKNRTFLPGV